MLYCIVFYSSVSVFDNLPEDNTYVNPQITRNSMKNIFRAISNKVSGAAGSPYTFLLAFLVVVFWASSGPMFNFSNTWQLVINTGTTIITFLMVFLIQNTQNRDGKAVQLKLDELIRATNSP